MRAGVQSMAGCRVRRHIGDSAPSVCRQLWQHGGLCLCVMAMVDIGCPVAFLLYGALIFLWGSTLPLFSDHVVWMELSTPFLKL